MASAQSALVVASLIFGVASVDPYNESLAKRLVQYAGATYCSGSKSVSDWSCGPCAAVPEFRNISQFHASATDARSIVGYDPVLKARIVAFMGSNLNLKTWVDDILLWPTNCYGAKGCHGCKCHPGFLKAYESIADDVYRAVSSLPAGKLMITGHSLGAAMATHCAIDLHARGLSAPVVYTLGQPRIGNDAFANYYDRLKFDHWRVTHHRDPIPHLPWRGLGGYKHVLREVYYDSGSASATARLCDDGFAEDPECSDQFNDELTLPFLVDHWTYLGFSFAEDVIRCSFSEKTQVTLTIVQ
eukprot:CAMPEP_0172727526 /NCGR_PEP_ID=MMETSP1074-20121228/91729_1 /TAXON_ID=2916 /ORGANISM="Ceratium fusus, Strain PA161109" /LENGTH=299 /DNA_ID=CAMNT_0013554685 /DNA_START=33 /DNA_END=932 /DNA_ORIENTATION=+